MPRRLSKASARVIDGFAQKGAVTALETISYSIIADSGSMRWSGTYAVYFHYLRVASFAPLVMYPAFSTSVLA